MFASAGHYLMTTFIPRTTKNLNKASEYFKKLHHELDIDKYKLDKYRELFMLGSFQVMHDADLAYNDIYLKCAANAQSKESLLQCLEQEEKLLMKKPESFDGNVYRLNIAKCIAEIKMHILNGDLDYLYM
jgi:hypothetical protein